MSVRKVFTVSFIVAMIILINIPGSGDNLQMKPQGNSAKTSDYQVPINGSHFFSNYILRPVELTVKTVSALTSIPQQRVVCLTLAVASYKFLLPQELRVKEQVITAVFWVLVDSLEVPVVAEYTGEVKEFVGMMGRVAFIPVRVLGGVVSAVTDYFPWSGVRNVLSWTGDNVMQAINCLVDLAGPFFAHDKLIYLNEVIPPEHTVYTSWSPAKDVSHTQRSTALQNSSLPIQTSSVREFIHAHISRPVELTVKTVSALTMIPQQRIVCLTLAVTSYKFLLPQELTAKEEVITAVFWVLVDSLEVPVVAEYTEEVKEFGGMMGRIAFLPVRILGRIVSLTAESSWRALSCLVETVYDTAVHRIARPVYNSVVEWIVRPVYNTMEERIVQPVYSLMVEWIVRPVYNSIIDCLTQSFNMVMQVHNWCWPVISRCYNYLVFPLFVHNEPQSSPVHYVLYTINTVLHTAYSVIRLLLLDPISTLVYYSWTDMSLNYNIGYWIKSVKHMAWYIVIYNWELTLIACLICLWIWSMINVVLRKRKRKGMPTQLRKILKRRDFHYRG